jgi:hypothetical protein
MGQLPKPIVERRNQEIAGIVQHAKRKTPPSQVDVGNVVVAENNAP